MFIDWPDLKAEVQREIELAVQRSTRAGAPMVVQTPHVIMVEGNQADLIYPDGTRTEMRMERHQYSLRIEPQGPGATENPSLPEIVEKLSTAMAADMERSLYHTLENASPRTGGLFSGNSAEEIAQEIMKVFETMDFGFDEAGRPDVVITLSPKAYDFITNFKSAELQQQIEAIVERKRREWVRRESHRRLVD